MSRRPDVRRGFAQRLLIALLVVAAAVGLRVALIPLLGEERPYLTLFGGVALAAWLTRWKTAALAGGAGFFAANLLIGYRTSEFRFDAYLLAELAGFAVSCGLIILAVEAMHRARDRAWRSRELLRVTLGSIGDGVIVADDAGRVVSLNAEAERLTGWPTGDAVGRPLEEVFRIINETTRERVESPVEKVFRLGVVVGLANHTVLISRGGAETPIDDSAAPIREDGGPLFGVVMVFRDVSAQRAAQRAQARLAAIVETSADAIIAKDLNGVIQSWNPAAEALFGYREEEAIGRPILMLVPPDRAHEEGEILARLHDGLAYERFETVRVARDGRRIPVAASASPLRDAEGQVIGASSILRDITEIAAAREALVREKELLATTLASIGDAVITTDAEAQITYLNRVAESVTGWSLDEAVGRPLDDVFRIIDETNRQSALNPALRALQDGVVMGLANHTILIRRDGSECPIDDSAAPIHDAAGEIIGCVLIFRDIAQRRQAERELSESRARLRAIVAQLPVGVGVMDASGRWTMSNPIMDELMPDGVPSRIPERASQWQAWDEDGKVIPPEQWPGNRALAGESVSALEMLRRAEDGQEHWLQVSAAPLRDESGRVIGATCVAQNIAEAKQSRSERQRLQAELAARVEELQAILDTAPVQIWFGDAECKEIYGNRHAYEVHRLRVGGDAPAGVPVVELPEGFSLEVEGRTLRPDEMPMQVAARTGKPFTAYEFDVVAPDKLRRTMWANISPLLNPDGTVRRVVGVYIDITDHRRADAERRTLLESERAARAQAERTARVKDEFLATLSHELRTPLNAILGWSRLIEAQINDLKTVKEGIQIITRNAKMQAELIADLLDMSRIISGKLRLEVDDLNLSEVVSAGIDSIRHAAEAKGIVVQSNLDRSVGAIRGDARRLQQVIWNLLSNAVKFTPRGGKIRVSLQERDGHAEIAISDSGMGIKPEFLPHLFERFRQGDSSASRQHGGLGLGLSIVKHLVEMHGGSVRAESAGEGRGSTFIIELALSTERPSGGTPAPLRERVAEPDPYDFTDVRVLAIDDQADARELIARVLDECNAQVVVAATAEEGLDALAAHRPHIVLCDIGMPLKNGYDFIEEIRRRGDTTPALAVTAFARGEDRLRALRAGYQGHVTKPVEPAELLATIAAFVIPPPANPHIRGRQEES